MCILGIQIESSGLQRKLSPTDPPLQIHILSFLLLVDLTTFKMLGIEPRISPRPGKHSTTDRHPTHESEGFCEVDRHLTHIKVQAIIERNTG